MNLKDEQLKTVALPIWKNIVGAAAEQSYARFSRGFSDELLSKLSEEHFLESCKDYPLLTSIAEDYQLIGSIQRENGVTILWRLTSTQLGGEFLGQLTLQTGKSGMEIAGVSVS
jgi:hypothetical protein